MYILSVAVVYYVSFDTMAEWITNIVTESLKYWFNLDWVSFFLLPSLRTVIYISFCVLWWILSTTSFKFIILSLTRLWIKPLSTRVKSIVLHNIISSTPSSSPFSLLKWITNIQISLKHASEELILTTLCWIIGFILPGFGILTIFISSYYSGIQMLWFIIERKGDYEDQKEYCRNHWGLMMAVGLVFYGLMAFPVVGCFIAIPYATISGFLVLYELDGKNK